MKNQLTVDQIKQIGSIYGTRGNSGFESTYLTEYVKLSEFLSNADLKDGFIEIGSAWGASFHLIANHIQGIKISVDIPFDQNFGMEAWPPGLTIDVLSNRELIWKSNFDNVYSIIGNSQISDTIEKVKVLVTKPVSFLYIDAEHSRVAAELDFNNYKQFVQPGGYIGFHDIQLGEPYYLTEMWNDLKKSYTYIELLGENECIGIIQL